MEDIRWKQRYDNLAKAFSRLKEGVDGFDFDHYLKLRQSEEMGILHDNTHGDLGEMDLKREGIVQRFEYTYELFINTLRDLLFYGGEPIENIKSPRDVLKQALSNAWIENHDGWRSVMKSQNLTSHTYDQATADTISANIHQKYLPLMKHLFKKLTDDYNQAS